MDGRPNSIRSTIHGDGPGRAGTLGFAASWQRGPLEAQLGVHIARLRFVGRWNISGLAGLGDGVRYRTAALLAAASVEVGWWLRVRDMAVRLAAGP